MKDSCKFEIIHLLSSSTASGLQLYSAYFPWVNTPGYLN